MADRVAVDLKPVEPQSAEGEGEGHRKLLGQRQLGRDLLAGKPAVVPFATLSPEESLDAPGQQIDEGGLVLNRCRSHNQSLL